MPVAKPFHERRMDVVHLALDERSEPVAGAPGGPVLLVLWRGDVPVAHSYVHLDQDGKLPKTALEMPAAQTGPNVSYARTGNRPSVSLVICTRDRAALLERCLSSLRDQSLAPDEIVVVDNASRDGATWEVCLAHGVKYVRENMPGLDFARNSGVKSATSEIVAFADDDVILHRKWLERLVDAFDSETIMAVTGLVLPAELESRAQIVFERHWGFGRGYQRIDFDRDFFERYRPLACPSWEIGAGANMAFRRCVFEEVGYFDERLDVGAAGCSGDSEFWYRVLAAGWTCRYQPDAVAFHFHRRSEAELARQLRAYMRGHVAALLVQFERHNDMGSLRRVMFTLPKWYLSRSLSRIRHGVNDANAFLFYEMSGALSGLLFYLRTPRPAREKSL